MTLYFYKIQSEQIVRIKKGKRNVKNTNPFFIITFTIHKITKITLKLSKY